jgi:hypothetical protein
MLLHWSGAMNAYWGSGSLAMSAAESAARFTSHLRQAVAMGA